MESAVVDKSESNKARIMDLEKTVASWRKEDDLDHCAMVKKYAYLKMNEWELQIRNGLAEDPDLQTVNYYLGRLARIRKSLHLYEVQASQTAEMVIQDSENSIEAEEVDGRMEE